jgi:signal transduction histidine kinase
VERHAAARLEAEAASRAKSEFLAVMSHELRTPLNAIGGHVQLLEMGIHGAVTAQQHEALLRIARSQRHLLTLINNVLNLAHIESGHVEYAVMDVPIAPLLHDVTQMLEPLLTAKTLTCTVQGPKVAPIEGFIARADREKLQQILLNLLTNSIKFTPAGGRIVVTPEYDPHTPDVISIQVRDTGIGIDPGQLDSIFEPFVQLRTGRTIGQQEGVGLGLAISRDLARGMKGDLLAESVLGDGATFTLRLPRA